MMCMNRCCRMHTEMRYNITFSYSIADSLCCREVFANYCCCYTAISNCRCLTMGTVQATHAFFLLALACMLLTVLRSSCRFQGN